MKYWITVLLICITVTALAQTRKQYKIGDSALCGIVFHVQALDSFGAQRILVCSLKDQSASSTWYNDRFISTNAVKDVLFDRDNAEKIIGIQGDGNYAAALCRNFSLNDSSCPVRDTLWYLPSVAELKLMFKNLDSIGKANFANEGYWSSVEFADNLTSKRPRRTAWIVDFLNGKSFPVNKSNKYHVRAVREFRN